MDKIINFKCLHNAVNIQDIINEIEASKPRSAWGKGVKKYAIDLLEEEKNAQEHENSNIISTLSADNADKLLLNGAKDWSEYSWGGCSLIYDGDIAERLCSPSELKKSRNGERNPNSRETWIDCQARALYQASNLITRIARRT